MRIPGLALAVVLSAAAAVAQPAGQPGPPPFAPGEIQRLLDGYAIVQAQEFLGMTDAEFGPFLPKLRALQDIRRRNEQQRVRLLQDLRRLAGPRGQGSDVDIRERLRGLAELQGRAVAEVQHAYEAIDQSLNVRQQARFRIFEQEIEQRKLQLLMRARQQNRANRPPANPQTEP
jgi:hypothetical protein